MLGKLDTRRSALVNYVFRRLTRGRMTAEQIPGAAFAQEIQFMRASQFTAIVIVEMPGGEIGRLLYYKGRLVYVARGDLEPVAALRKITEQIAESFCTYAPLDAAKAALALASIDGEVVGAEMIGEETPSWQAHAVLETLKRQGFSGLLSLEARNNLFIWWLQDGSVLLSPQDLPDTEHSRMVQIAWAERELPEVTLEPASPEAFTPQAAPMGGKLWSVFAQVLRDEIGDRSSRTVAVLQEQLRDESPERLLQNLRKQLERMAGAAAVRRFLERVQ